MMISVSKRKGSRRRGKVLVAAGATSALMLLAGCSGGNQSDTTDESANAESGEDTTISEEAPAESGGTITFVAAVKGDPFYITMSCGAEQAAEEAGYQFDFQAPNTFSPTDQIPIVDGVSAAAPAALLIAPTDEDSMFAPIERVVNAGTKVVLVDTTLSDTSSVAASVKTDDYAAGQQAAEALSEEIGGSGEVLLLNLLPGVSTTEARGQGFLDKAEELGLTVVSHEYGGTEVEKSAQIVDGTLQRHPELAGIFTTTDYGAQGAITSLRNAGRLGDVKIVGFDASPAMVAELESGNIQVIVSQQALVIGKTGVEEALKAIRGESNEQEIEIPTVVIRAADLDDPAILSGLQADACN